MGKFILCCIILFPSFAVYSQEFSNTEDVKYIADKIAHPLESKPSVYFSREDTLAVTLRNIITKKTLSKSDVEKLVKKVAGNRDEVASALDLASHYLLLKDEPSAEKYYEEAESRLVRLINASENPDTVRFIQLAEVYNGMMKLRSDDYTHMKTYNENILQLCKIAVSGMEKDRSLGAVLNACVSMLFESGDYLDAENYSRYLLDSAGFEFDSYYYAGMCGHFRLLDWIRNSYAETGVPVVIERNQELIENVKLDARLEKFSGDPRFIALQQYFRLSFLVEKASLLDSRNLYNFGVPSVLSGTDKKIIDELEIYFLNQEKNASMRGSYVKRYLGTVYLLKKNEQKTVMYFNRLQDEYPSDSGVMEVLVPILCRQADGWKVAVKLIEKRMRLKPEWTDHLYLSYAYSKGKQKKESLASIDKALSERNDRPDACYLAYLMCLKEGEFAKAKECFEKFKPGMALLRIDNYELILSSWALELASGEREYVLRSMKDMYSSTQNIKRKTEIDGMLARINLKKTKD